MKLPTPKLHTKESLMRNLTDIGICSTDTLLVHSSMKSIGRVDGGADTVLDALSGCLSQGLLIMPSHTWSYINADNPVFDVKESKSCVGLLSEMFRKRPNVIRTLHPTHSLSAFGANAAEFTAGQEKFNTPCAPESCYGKLGEMDAKVLMIGVDFSRNTLVHCIEEVAKVPGRMTDTCEQLFVKDLSGNLISVPSRRHNNANSENYVKLEPVMFRHNVLHKVQFGDADCLLFHAKDLFSITLALLHKNPRLFDNNDPIV